MPKRFSIFVLVALAAAACGGPSAANPTAAPAAPSGACPAPTQAPAFLLVDPVATPTGALEVELGIRIASAPGGPGRAITKGADAGPNGTLVIETASGAFGVNRIKLLPDTTHRLSITVEYDELGAGTSRDAAGNCGTQNVRRKLTATADANGTPLVIVQSQALAGAAASPGATPIAGAGQSPVSGPTMAPPPTVVPANTGACADTAAFVADVTIPDGSDVTGGSAQTKTWRVRNSGACAWTSGYSLLRTSVSAGLTAPDSAPLAATVNPGDSADVSVAFAAPSAPGLYQAAYKLRGPDGAPFGPALTVSFRVPGSVAPSGCAGNPVIASFTADRVTPLSNQFTLRWGPVTNADRVELDNGIGGVAAPGERTISISANTTYRLTAKCGANAVSSAVNLVYNLPLAIISFAGSWATNFGTMNLSQSGTSVTGTYVNAFSGVNGTIQGTVSGNTLNGTYTIGGGSGPIQFTINSNTFDGNWGGSSQWCGARTGQSFPSGCAYAGSWIASVAGNTSCAMTLVQNGTTVSGNYCNGTLNGTVTYGSGYALLTGNWAAGGSGPFKFYLLGYNGDQFQGNWNTSNPWCGRRSSATLPATCLR